MEISCSKCARVAYLRYSTEIDPPPRDPEADVECYITEYDFTCIECSEKTEKEPAEGWDDDGD